MHPTNAGLISAGGICDKAVFSYPHLVSPISARCELTLMLWMPRIFAFHMHLGNVAPFEIDDVAQLEGCDHNGTVGQMPAEQTIARNIANLDPHSFRPR